MKKRLKNLTLNNISKFIRVYVVTVMFVLFIASSAHAAMPSLNFTVNMSENVMVNTTGGTPTIALTVDDKPRIASYVSGTGTNALTFTYNPTIGDVDLDGIAITSPYNIIPNGGTIKDASGNDASLSFTPPVTTGVKLNYPSLGMDFVYDADGRYTLNGAPYNSLSSLFAIAGGSFTRSSIGTYIDSAGVLQTAAANTPRFDYDPVTHAAKGILIEENRTNLITNGQGQGSSGVSYPTGWNRDQPFGGIELSSMSSGTSSNGYGYFQFTVNGTTTIGNRLLLTPTTTRANVTAGQAYTFSYGIQLISGTYPYTIQPSFMWYDSGGVQLSTSVGSIRTPTNSWARYSDTLTPPLNTTSVRIRYDFTGYGGPVGTLINFTMQLSGVQLEQGSFPTSYIPTTSATVTRAADVLSIPTAGWFNTNTGTIFANANTIADSTFISGNRQQLFLLSDGGLSRLTMRLNSSGSGMCTIGNGTANSDLYFDTTTQGAYRKMACSYDLTSSSSSYNGTSPNSGVGYAGVSYTPANIGSSAGIQSINGYIKTLKFYPLRATNTQLQLLTQ